MSTTNDPRLQRVRRELENLLLEAEAPEEIDYYESLLRDFNEGLLMLEDALEQLRIGMYRNPGFPGDEVGWLDDDLTMMRTTGTNIECP